jgi:hypothetical protein
MKAPPENFSGRYSDAAWSVIETALAKIGIEANQRFEANQRWRGVLIGIGGPIEITLRELLEREGGFYVGKELIRSRTPSPSEEMKVYKEVLHHVASIRSFLAEPDWRSRFVAEGVALLADDALSRFASSMRRRKITARSKEKRAAKPNKQRYRESILRIWTKLLERQLDDEGIIIFFQAVTAPVLGARAASDGAIKRWLDRRRLTNKKNKARYLFF